MRAIGTTLEVLRGLAVRFGPQSLDISHDDEVALTKEGRVRAQQLRAQLGQIDPGVNAQEG